MSCEDAVVQRLQGQISAMTTEFSEMVQTANPLNTTSLFYNAIAGTASNAASTAISQATNALQASAETWLRDAATDLVNVFTFSDEMQVVLFARLRDTLRDYLTKRIVLTSDVRKIIGKIIGILGTLPPSAQDEIVRMTRSARADIQSAINYLKAAENGLRESPPVAFRGYSERAGDRVTNAMETLGGDIADAFAEFDPTDPSQLKEVDNILKDYAGDLESKYRIAILGIAAYIMELAKIIMVPMEFNSPLITLGPLLGFNVSLFNTNDTIDAISPKIKSTAQLVVTFPFHITMLNQLINIEAERLRTVKEKLVDVRNDMDQKLQSDAVARGNFYGLYGAKVIWSTKLGLISTLLGSNNVTAFAALSDPVNNLIEQVTAIQRIITYLSQPDYIRDMNDHVVRMKASIVEVLPSLFAAFASENSHRRALVQLNDILLHCSMLSQQDMRLVSLLNKLELRPTENALVAQAIAAYDAMLGRAGGQVADLLGLSDGTVAGRIVEILAPSAISTVGTPIANFVLPGNAEDRFGEIGSASLLSNLSFGGLGTHLQSLIDCMADKNTATNTVDMVITPEALEGPEAIIVDSLQGVTNNQMCLSMRVNNMKILNIQYPEMIAGTIVLADQFPDEVV